MVGKVKRERERFYGYDYEKNSSEKNFSQVLKEASEQQSESAPRECHTTTYGRNMQLEYFMYRTREYHY